jgi:hypothetical protein
MVVVLGSRSHRAASVIDPDGVGSFESSPSVTGAELALDGQTPMQKLRTDLIDAFKGQRLTVFEVYARHNEGTLFTIKNYQDALRGLPYDEKPIEVERGEFMPLPEMTVRKRHMSENCVVTFPS